MILGQILHLNDVFCIILHNACTNCQISIAHISATVRARTLIFWYVVEESILEKKWPWFAVWSFPFSLLFFFSPRTWKRRSIRIVVGSRPPVTSGGLRPPSVTSGRLPTTILILFRFQVLGEKNDIKLLLIQIRFEFQLALYLSDLIRHLFSRECIGNY